MSLNYSAMLDHDEADLVVAGPGAINGISKCFRDTEGRGRSAETVIRWVYERQNLEFAQRGLDFPGLFGRPLQPVDCQNLFCEISKYARTAHPDISGISGRTRIKQSYEATNRPLASPHFLPRWRLNSPHDMIGQATDQALLL
ncbi:nucleotide kinase domain-containing protein [Acetobacter okinawensis]|uniref:nucleotide kinase domain-containing protein n=1 Tax=Acetobacter okinawensis TaxID=1076594 RepID=UPI00214DC647|nr:nucleotide kinase domain-containing protein [Acetobacter okinawensis]